MKAESTRRIRIENRAPQAGKTRLRLTAVERGAQPFRSARPVVGLRRVFRAIETACSDGFRHERAEWLKEFTTNGPG